MGRDLTARGTAFRKRTATTGRQAERQHNRAELTNTGCAKHF